MDNTSHNWLYNMITSILVMSGINVINYVAHNYDKIAGTTLTVLSIGYLIWKWRNEYVKSKKA